MKRAYETPAWPGRAYANTNVGPGLRTSQQPATSTASTTTASTATTTGIPPGMTDRTRTALWPAAPMPLQAGYYTHPDYQPQPQPRALEHGVPPSLNNDETLVTLDGQRLPPSPTAPPATPPARLTGHQGGNDLFTNTALNFYVSARIPGPMSVWMKTANLLKGQERTNFLIVSFYHIVKFYDSSGIWNGVIHMIMATVDMATMLAQKWPRNLSFLHLLAALKDHEWIDLALAMDGVPQFLHSGGARGFSPLHIAASVGKKKIVQAILFHDDDAGSLRLKKNTDNNIPLHLACLGNHGSTTALLLSRKGTEQRLSTGRDRYLPIHAALVFNGVVVLPYLLAQCALEQVSRQTAIGRNALMLAILFAPPKAVRMLLDIPGALAVQLDARDSKGLGAIDHARVKGNVEVIALVEAAMQTVQTGAASTAITSSMSMGTGATHPYPAMGVESTAPLTPDPFMLAFEDQSGYAEADYDETFY